MSIMIIEFSERFMWIITFVVKTSVDFFWMMNAFSVSSELSNYLTKTSFFYLYFQILLPHEYSVSFKILKYVFFESLFIT